MVVTSNRCDFRNHRRGYAAAALHRPVAHVMDVQSATVTRVPFAGNGLRQLLEATFAADPANSGRYLAPPDVTVAVTPAGGAAASATGSLVPNIGRSVAADRVRYRVRVEQGDRSFGRLPTGPCTLAIRAACADPRTCPAGQADFGAGCVDATPTSAVCPDGKVKVGRACVPASECPVGQASFGDGAGCVRVRAAVLVRGRHLRRGRRVPGRDAGLGRVRRPLRLLGEPVRVHGAAGAGGPVEPAAGRGAVERPGEQCVLRELRELSPEHLRDVWWSEAGHGPPGDVF